MDLFGKIKISDLGPGFIIWNSSNILGITKSTLPEKYYSCYCTKTPGNYYDYEIVKDEAYAEARKKK